MSLALLAAVVLAAPPSLDWRFVDESTHAGRSVLTFRSVELADTPIAPLHADDRPPTGTQFSIVALGPSGKHRMSLVWHTATAALWLDADADGRFAASERHTLGSDPFAIRMTIPYGAGKSHERTLLIRRRGQGLAYAVRGYTTGFLTLGGQSISALLTDGNSDGCFDTAGIDRVWLDLDGNGRFDPFTEQFPLGNALTVGTRPVLIQPDADGLAVRVRERPSETGSLMVRINRLAATEVVELSAQYVSEFGELVTVRSADQTVSVPAGKYRLDGLAVKIADDDGQVWHYSFSCGERSFDTVVTEKRETMHAPLAGLKLDFKMDASARSGDTINIQPEVTAGELYLTVCEVAPRRAERGREMTAEIALCEPGNSVIDRVSSGFM